MTLNKLQCKHGTLSSASAIVNHVLKHHQHIAAWLVVLLELLTYPDLLMTAGNLSPQELQKNSKNECKRQLHTSSHRASAAKPSPLESRPSLCKLVKLKD